MNFKIAKAHLLEIFEQNNFIENVQSNKKHTNQIIIDTCNNGTKISVSFPGYKACVSGSKIVYDYRVDMTKNGIITALSHTNIITDIYNKIVNCKMSPNELSTVLIEVFKEGNIDLSSIASKLTYRSVPPNQELILRVKNGHGGKVYNPNGNITDLTLEELFKSIKWIVLQEDINYPIAKNFEGRKMPLARYLETIFITENPSHTLEEVIDRALIHLRPKEWPEMDYSFKSQIC